MENVFTSAACSANAANNSPANCFILSSYITSGAMPRPFAPFLAFLHARDANHLRTPFATGWMVVGTNGGGSADWIVGTLGSVFDEQFPGKHARLARERRRYKERRQYDAYQRL